VVNSGQGALATTFGKTSVRVVSAAKIAKGAPPLDLKSLLVVARASPKQAQSDDAVHYDHDCGEHGVPRQPCFLRRSRQHD
jgi:hypothetical protein